MQNSHCLLCLVVDIYTHKTYEIYYIFLDQSVCLRRGHVPPEYFSCGHPRKAQEKEHLTRGDFHGVSGEKMIIVALCLLANLHDAIA